MAYKPSEMLGKKMNMMDTMATKPEGQTNDYEGEFGDRLRGLDADTLANIVLDLAGAYATPNELSGIIDDAEANVEPVEEALPEEEMGTEEEALPIDEEVLPEEEMPEEMVPEKAAPKGGLSINILAGKLGKKKGKK